MEPCVIMRFGINSFLFTSPFTNDSTKLFKTFKRWGFESVEIPIEDPSHIDPAHVKAKLDKAGLMCGSVCACLGPACDLHGGEAPISPFSHDAARVLDKIKAELTEALVQESFRDAKRQQADVVSAANVEHARRYILRRQKNERWYVKLCGILGGTFLGACISKLSTGFSQPIDYTTLLITSLLGLVGSFMLAVFIAKTE